MTTRDRLSPATIAVTSGRPAHEPGQPLNTPIAPASALVPGGDSEYSRDGNPTWTAFEHVLGDLEGGHAVSFASGMAATTAVVDAVPVGGVVVAPRAAYAGTLHLLHQRAASGLVDLRLVDVDDTAAVIAAAQSAAMVWVESPTNPMLQVADVRAITDGVADETIVVVDNTFASPLRRRPLGDGADLVVHSVSKVLAGHSDLVMGAVVTADEDVHRQLVDRRTATGAIPGVLESYLAARGVRTLAVRLDRAETTAAELRSRLVDDPRVAQVRYPGFGTVVSFELTGGAEAADAATRASQVVVHTTSLGGVESTWERRRRHPAEPDAVPDGLIRLSVGLEDVDDLWDDIAQAIDRAVNA